MVGIHYHLLRVMSNQPFQLAHDDLMVILLINLQKSTPDVTHMLLNATLPDWLLSFLTRVDGGFYYIRGLVS